MKKATGLFLLMIIFSFLASGFLYSKEGLPQVLPVREQARVVNAWLEKRLEVILPEIMRREGVDMWLVICQEYNEDPVFLTLVPFEHLSARRLSMLVFFDRGRKRAWRSFQSAAIR